jgi:hypothetical protein
VKPHLAKCNDNEEQAESSRQNTRLHAETLSEWLIGLKWECDIKAGTLA